MTFNIRILCCQLYFHSWGSIIVLWLYWCNIKWWWLTLSCLMVNQSIWSQKASLTWTKLNLRGKSWCLDSKSDHLTLWKKQHRDLQPVGREAAWFREGCYCRGSERCGNPQWVNTSPQTETNGRLVLDWALECGSLHYQASFLMMNVVSIFMSSLFAPPTWETQFIEEQT